MKLCFTDKETNIILGNYLAENQQRVYSEIHCKVRAEGPLETC